MEIRKVLCVTGPVMGLVTAGVAGVLAAEGAMSIAQGNVGLGVAQEGAAVFNAFASVVNETFFMLRVKNMLPEELLKEENRAFSKVRI